VSALLPLANGRAQITELVLPAGARADGRLVSELSIPSGTLIASVIRGDELSIPGGATRLVAGDRLVLISRRDDEEPLVRALIGA
jgi:trk system potassium uptake protein TrkA